MDCFVHLVDLLGRLTSPNVSTDALQPPTPNPADVEGLFWTFVLLILLMSRVEALAATAHLCVCSDWPIMG